MTTITSVAPVISATGISAPAYSDILAYLIAKYQGIYGTDIYLGADSQDYQSIAIYASAINDTNAAIIADYNSRSPSTSQGAALSSAVKINGLARYVPTNSTVDQIIVGQAFTPIINGVTQDSNGNKWSLPASVTIPSGGTITVTATCQTPGAVAASIGTVNRIATPTLGWQSVTNASAAVPGAPIETDSQLRQRQGNSTALPALTPVGGIKAAVSALIGVTQCVIYENDTGTTNALGIPAHAIAAVVQGGDVTQIASMIALKKTPGTSTFGTTTQTVPDTNAIPTSINFSRPTNVAITVAISLHALAGYSTTVGATIQNAVASYINSVTIGGGQGNSVEWDSCIAAAKGVAGSSTFKIVSLTVSGPGGAGTPDVAIAYNQTPTCTAASVTLTQV
jgi:uncharacterized phage protein gp47/JayE